MREFEDICDRIRTKFDDIDDAREQSLAISRKIIRNSGDAIKAIHRAEWDAAQGQIKETRELVLKVNEVLRDFPDIYYSGYVGDSQAEYAEVSLLVAFLHDTTVPSPETLQISESAYLKGAGDAIGELRRHILDMIRTGHPEEGEKYLELMDEIYTQLMAFDYPDAITHGLRKKTDVARSLIERTRGDLTNALQAKDLKESLGRLEKRLE